MKRKILITLAIIGVVLFLAIIGGQLDSLDIMCIISVAFLLFIMGGYEFIFGIRKLTLKSFFNFIIGIIIYFVFCLIVHVGFGVLLVFFFSFKGLLIFLLILGIVSLLNKKKIE